MPAIHIFQIYYSNETREALDRGFQPLDNLKNERPDWREYWPIRNYMKENKLTSGDYYGFLSATKVIEFVQDQAGGPDVVMFSPYYDQIAFFLNQWEQGAIWHKTSFVFEESLALIAPDFGMYKTACTSRN